MASFATSPLTDRLSRAAEEAEILTVDYDKSTMMDGESPIDGLTCADLRRYAALMREARDRLHITPPEALRTSVLEEAAKECDALGRTAPNPQRGFAYDIAAKCIRDLKRDADTPLTPSPQGTT